MTHPEPAVVLFDGVCNLCNASVHFILRRDARAAFRFASLQSDAARALLADRGHGEPGMDTVVLVEGARVSTRSTAALRIVRRLRFPWPLLYAFVVVPRPVRDAVYRWIGRNRYRWFGRREQCMTPRPGDRDRFLE